MAIGMTRPTHLWFGTRDRMQWFPTPVSGAESSPQDWTADGTLLNGGAYAMSSWGSHKLYNYEWRGTSSREVAQCMKSYGDGTFGRGLLYFVDPLTYDTNVLPARWADPSITVGYEGPQLVRGVEPRAFPSGGGVANALPVSVATFDLTGVQPGFRGESDAVYIPIPEGYTLLLGSVYTASGSGGVFASPSPGGSGALAPVRLTQLLSDATNVVQDAFSGVQGVWLWIGRTIANASTVQVRSIIGRLIRSDYAAPAPGGGEHPQLTKMKRGPWYGGQGHSGARMIGKPTYISNTGVNGGQIGFAATFREVGDAQFGTPGAPRITP